MSDILEELERLVKSAEEWEWSSAYARKHKKGLIPDIFAMPAKQSDPQSGTIFL